MTAAVKQRCESGGGGVEVVDEGRGALRDSVAAWHTGWP